MNKIYEQQVICNKAKIEESARLWKRKHMSNAVPPVNTSMGKPKSNKIENPVEPDSELSNYTGTDLAWDVAGTVDPTGAIDLVNAVRYAGTGDWSGAGISALGAIPVIGDTLKGLGRTVKTTTAITKAIKPTKKLSNIMDLPGVKRKMSSSGLHAAANAAANASGTSLSLLPKTQNKLSNITKSAIPTAVGAAAATVANKMINNIDNSSNIDSDKDQKQKNIMLDPIPQIGLDIHKLDIFHPGEASRYSKSVVTSRRHGEDLPAGYHPYFTGPINIELNRRRSYYAQSKGLPESVEFNNIFKNKIKKTVNNYLQSKGGNPLLNHLNSIRKTIEQH